MKKIIILLFFFIFMPAGVSASLGCLDYGMAYEDYTGYCKCMSGYVWGTNFLGEPYCVSGDSVCHDKYGYHSRYNSLQETCECSYGYIFAKDSFGHTKCLDPDDICHDKLGYNSKYNSLYDKCECNSGYELSVGSLGSLTCLSCISKYGFHSSYNYLSDQCECDSGYTLKDGECIEKQNNVYFYLKELDTDNKLAIIKSNYDYKYYLVNYGSGCYSASFRRYLRDNIVVNLGTDFYVDRYDTIVLYDDDEVCYIMSVTKVDSSYTLEEEEDTYSFFNYINIPEQNNNVVDNKITTVTEQEQKNDDQQEIVSENKVEIKDCGVGFSLSLDKTHCVKIPDNAHAVDSSTDVWLCNEGYEELGNTCVSKQKEENLTTSTQQSTQKETVNNHNEVTKSKVDKILDLIVDFFKKLKFW